MLSRVTILAALEQLSSELGKAGVLGELNIVGGTAMVLAFDARNATKDVDAIFEPSQEIRTAASAVARDMDLPSDWLNDDALVPLKSLELPNLRVQTPTPEYMLAMKVLAARAGAGDSHGDARDIAFLIRLLWLRDSDAVMGIVSRYYDPSRILPRSVYLVDEILEEMQF